MKKQLVMVAALAIMHGSVYASAKARLFDAIRSGRQIVLVRAGSIPKKPVSRIGRSLDTAAKVAQVYIGYQVLKPFFNPLLPSPDDFMMSEQKTFFKKSNAQVDKLLESLVELRAELAGHLLLFLLSKNNQMCSWVYASVLFCKETDRELGSLGNETKEAFTSEKKLEIFFQGSRECALLYKNDPEFQKCLRESIAVIYSNEDICHFSWVDKKNLVVEQMVAKDLKLDIKHLIEEPVIQHFASDDHSDE